ncbi:hypothetical protein JTE90_015278 [Oedothorax gibbosus]|uniref:Major facilitator superfamily (MFS) profile domain-containing protein n=1 Tax=Oedothorax gibbosus TaxID=931172 RepID=A0AAV6UC95_9ARAC|nr:hypothetical protein JTE90_015278 [Oedothorax gibbosus]
MSENNDQQTANDEKEESYSSCCKCSGVRYLFAMSGMLGMSILYMLRVNMSMAVVAMVNKTAVYGAHMETVSECGDDLPILEETHIIRKEGEFDWSPAIQGVILGSFYYGYSFFQIPGGRLAEIYDSKWVFAIGTGMSALLALLVPLAARSHTGLLIALRMTQGLAQGLAMPSIYSLLGRWAPESERTVIETLTLSGVNIGTVVGIPLTATLCNSQLFGGWPSAFYVFGFVGCMWFILWTTTVKEKPQNCPCIIEDERDYIVANQTMDPSHNLLPIPWVEILTFGPYWAITFAQVVGDWLFYLILNDLPIFYSTILHFNIEQNGLMSSLPFLLQSIVGCLAGYASDAVIRKKMASPTLIRKICGTIGCVGSSLGLAVCCVAGCSVLAHTVAFAFIMAMGGFFYCSYMVNILDLSPEYAGTLIGIASTLSNVTGFLTPMLVGALTEDHQTLARWRIVFLITIVLLLSSAFIFFKYSTSEKQNWTDDHHKERRQRWCRNIANFACWRQKTPQTATKNDCGSEVRTTPTSV